MKVATFVCFILLISLRLYGQERIPYLSHGKYGYADPQGKVRIMPVYDEVKFFDRFEIAAVRIDTQWFLINKEGIRLVSLEKKEYNYYHLYQALSAHGPVQFGSRENVDAIPNLVRQELYASKGRRYIHTLSGRVSPVFSDFSRFHQERGMLTGFEGILNHGICFGQTGENEFKVMNTEAEILATTSVRPIRLNDSLISYMKDDISVILNFKTNTSFTLPYYTTSACISGTDFIVSNIHESLDQWNRSNLSLQKGVVDRNGKVIIQPQYDDLKPFAEKNLLAKKGDFNFFITPEGNRVDSNLYRHVFDEIGHTYYQAQLPNLKWIFLDTELKQAIPGEFDIIDYNQNCECFFVKAGDTAAILDSNLFNEISHTADAVYRSYQRGYYIFERNNKQGLLDQEGNEIIPALYDQCQPSGISDIVIIQQNDLKGLISFSGNLLLEPQFEDIHVETLERQPYLLVKKDGMYAYFDKQLNQLSDFQPKLRYLHTNPIYWERDENDSYSLYDRFGQPLGFTGISFDEGYVQSDSTYLMLVHKNDTSFLLYERNSKINIDTFQSSDTLSYNLEVGLVGVKELGLEGVRHYQGQWRIPLAEHRILFISPYLIVCQKDDQYWFYDLKGKKINTINSSELEIEPYMSVWRFEQNKKVGFISSYTGKTIVPPKYDEGFFHAHASNCVEVNSLQKNGTTITMSFDTLGNKLLKTRFDDLYPIDFRGTIYYYQVKKMGKYGLIDARGQIRIPLIYSSVYAYADTTFFSTYDKDKKWYIYNFRGDLVFSGTTLPVGNEKIELPNHQTYFTHTYDELPGHRYIFYFTDYSLIVDHMGRTLKRIDTTEVEEDGRKFQNYHFLEVTENGEVYVINKDSLISFREEPQR